MVLISVCGAATNNNLVDGVCWWQSCPRYVLIPIEISVCAGGSYKDVSHSKHISVCIIQYIIMADDSSPLQGTTYLELYLTPYLLHTGALYRVHTVSYHIKAVQMSRMDHSQYLSWMKGSQPLDHSSSRILPGIYNIYSIQHLLPGFSLDILTDINKAPCSGSF